MSQIEIYFIMQTMTKFGREVAIKISIKSIPMTIILVSNDMFKCIFAIPIPRNLF